jgi:DnaJ-class molecular chaperone
MAIKALSAEKTAEWKIVGKTTLHYECSKCGGAGDKWDKFCKHCGAKMSESEEEE